MNVKWGKFTKPDGVSVDQIEVTKSSDRKLFGRIAKYLKTELHGEWTEQLSWGCVCVCLWVCACGWGCMCMCVRVCLLGESRRAAV